MIYKYEVIDALGQKISGYLQANSMSQACLALREKKFQIVKIKKAIWSAFWATLRFVKKVSYQKLAMWCSSMSQMLGVGMSLDTALSVMQENSDDTLGSFTNSLKKDIVGGKTFSQAASKHKNIVNRLFISVIMMAEKTGQLAQAFNYLSTHYTFISKTRKQFFSAMYYPMFLGAVVFPVMLYFVVFLIPMFAQMIIEWGGELSYLTRGICGLSYLLSEYTYLVIASIGAVIVGVWYWNRESYIIMRTAYKIGTLRNMITAYYSTLFFHSLSQMLEQGIQLLDAFDTSKDMLHPIFTTDIDRVRAAIIQGSKLSDAVSTSRFLTDDVKKLLSIGEQSGQLSAVSNQIVEIYKAKLTDALNAVTQLMQPVLMTLIGGLFILLIVGGLLPLYNAVNLFNA